MIAAVFAVAVAVANDGATVPLARAGEMPHERLYARLDEVDGRVHGRWRRKKDAEFTVDELDDGTVLRVRRTVGGVTVEDRRYDAGGWPLVTVFLRPDGLPDRAVVHVQPEQTVALDTWQRHEMPGGAIVGPAPPVDLPGGSVRLRALDGELDVWTGPTSDPLSDAFRAGLVAGCGCAVLDRGAAWVDGRPGVRYRLLVPDAGPSEVVDLWAVVIPTGLWLATFRGGSDPEEALRAGRVLLALVTLDAEATP